MAKKPSLTDITSGYASNATVNSNNTAIEDAFDNTLSLDGSTPNAMNADLDLNSNDINNAGTVSASTFKVGGVTITSSNYVPDWKGGWVTATSYVINDMVREDGIVYICLEAHTSGTFSTDLGTTKWEVFAQKGSAGAGTGDLLAANNLSDVDNTTTARTNLGLSIGGTVQEYATKLQNIVDLTWAADKFIKLTSSSTLQTVDVAEVAVPSGAVFWFGASSAPTGYLECDGTAVSRTTYSTLFAVVGTVFGVGDGSTTFNLPDLRGEFVRGWDNGKGTDSGRTFGSTQADEFKSHKHDMYRDSSSTGDNNTLENSAGNDEGGLQSDQSKGWMLETGGSETRPVNVALLPCIKK